MSEYQYVEFRALDQPVNGKNLEYMRKQSSRAEITKWSFSNEYHFGDFGGNPLEMLRRGYDIHLHYANFGVRTLMIRLPDGFPDTEAAELYLDGESLRFERDKNGNSGSLVVEPAYESDALEELWDLDEVMDDLVPLRAEILAGDLRPLYLARLAVGRDFNHDPEETNEGPAPAGLQKLTGAQRALSEFYGLHESLLAAAARGAPPLPVLAGERKPIAEWIRRQSTEAKDRWLAMLMSDPPAEVRDIIQKEFLKQNASTPWPAANLNRSIAQLAQEAEQIAAQRELKAAAKAARQRANALAKMAANPAKVLRETEQLVATNSTAAYAQASELLADLREALAGAENAGMA